jgi:hypothetical protein
MVCKFDCHEIHRWISNIECMAKRRVEKDLGEPARRLGSRAEGAVKEAAGYF